MHTQPHHHSQGALPVVRLTYMSCSAARISTWLRAPIPAALRACHSTASQHDKQLVEASPAWQLAVHMCGAVRHIILHVTTGVLQSSSTWARLLLRDSCCNIQGHNANTNIAGTHTLPDHAVVSPCNSVKEGRKGTTVGRIAKNNI